MSKKITIRQKELLNHLPKAVRAEAVSKLSSVYVNRQPLKPFTPADDHAILLPCSSVIVIIVLLNVALIYANPEMSMDDNDMPLQIVDYIKYRFALKHPHVAMTKAEMDADFNKRFYIQDLSREDKSRNNEIQMKKDADKEFIKLSSSPKDMKRVIRLLSNVNPDRMTVEQIENSLYEIKNSNPKKFVRIATDKNLELKAEIEEMVTAGVLRKIGNQIIYIDEVLGENMDNAVVYLKDKKNSGTLTVMRAKLKELALA